jgi:arylsulfatase A-like enzyme
MVVRWPGVVDKESRSSTPVHVIDFYPTLLEVGGADPRKDQLLDGVSLLPLLKGKKIKDRPLFCHFPRNHPPSRGFGMEGGSFVRQGNYKLIRIYGEGPDRTDLYELYDLAADIGEENDLSSEMPEKVQELSALLDRWLEDTGALMPVKNPDYAF